MFSTKQALNRLGFLAKSVKVPKAFGMPAVVRNFKQVKDLNQVVATAQLEEEQRTEKFLEYTNKIYKPSKTIEFNREGEVLLFSCDNIKHSNVYFKYPYVMYDAMIPLAFYIFFADPFSFSWLTRHVILNTAWMFGWIPHYLYVKTLQRKLHKVFILRGGKYLRVVLNDFWGDNYNSWVTISELHLLSQDFKRFDDEKAEFLTSEGKLKYEVGIQCDHINVAISNTNNEVVYLMKEGTVHEPEILEQVVKGYNIDTTDFVINTEDNVRWLEPNKNY